MLSNVLWTILFWVETFLPTIIVLVFIGLWRRRMIGKVKEHVQQHYHEVMENFAEVLPFLPQMGPVPVMRHGWLTLFGEPPEDEIHEWCDQCPHSLLWHRPTLTTLHPTDVEPAIGDEIPLRLDMVCKHKDCGCIRLTGRGHVEVHATEPA